MMMQVRVKPGDYVYDLDLDKPVQVYLIREETTPFRQGFEIFTESKRRIARWTCLPQDKQLCSICRRVHGPETIHACE